MVIDGPLYKFIKISWLFVLISNDCTRLLQFSITDKGKNDDDTIIAITNIDIISIFTIYCPSLVCMYIDYSYLHSVGLSKTGLMWRIDLPLPPPLSLSLSLSLSLTLTLTLSPLSPSLPSSLSLASFPA